MSLDICILDEEGRPSRVVELGVEAHWVLIGRAVPEPMFPMVQRLRDYYCDASFQPSEVESLERELQSLRPTAESPSVVQDILALCAHARALDRGIEAVAD
jgi:hypothetical protein